jgi:hypothetical protein
MEKSISNNSFAKCRIIEILRIVRENMPIYYDCNDCKGVKITVTPNNRLFKKYLKIFSRSISVGEIIDITLRLEKRENFDAHFWEKRKVLSQLPKRNEEYAAEINWGEDNILEKRMVSIRTDNEGDVYYRMPKVELGFYDINSKDTIPIYFSKVVNKDEIRREIFIGLIMLIIGAILSFLVQLFK